MFFPPLISHSNIHASLKSSLTRLYFILHRNQEAPVRELIQEIFRKMARCSDCECYESLLRRIVLHTRSRTKGKGERLVVYVCLVEWFYYEPVQALEIIDSLVFNKPALGSWRDIRGIAEYAYRTEGNTQPLIRYCAFLIAHQLKIDYSKFLSQCPISNAVKWAPRERANTMWIFSSIVDQWADNTPVYVEKKVRAMKYRKICSALNMYLHTQKPLETRPHSCCLGKLVSLAISSGNIIPELLWQPFIEKQRKVFGSFSQVLPLIDARLEGADMYTAIGMSVCIAEMSSLGKRVLCMCHNPLWTSIQEKGFAESAQHIASHLSQSPPLCRIEHSIRMLVQSFVESGMTDTEIEQLCLVIFSSMDFGKEEEEVSLHDKIRAIFLMNSLQMPHIVYWGFSTHVFPCEFDTPRTTFISGETAAGLELVSDMHLAERRNMTPYLAMKKYLRA
jgi:hypothetical protein